MLYKELLNILSSNPLIIDLRDNEDYNIFHLPNAININYIDLIMNPSDYLQKDLTYYLICDKGTISEITIKKLKDYNYNLISISDGYNFNT